MYRLREARSLIVAVGQRTLSPSRQFNLHAAMPADRPRVDLIFTCQMSCHFSTPIAAGLCSEAVSGADTGRHQLDPSRDNRPQFLPLINRTHTPADRRFVRCSRRRATRVGDCCFLCCNRYALYLTTSLQNTLICGLPVIIQTAVIVRSLSLHAAPS